MLKKVTSKRSMVSMKKKPKSINALMAYMRDEKGLSISGSSDKKKT